jgi:hypothetical protein
MTIKKNRKNINLVKIKFYIFWDILKNKIIINKDASSGPILIFDKLKKMRKSIKLLSKIYKYITLFNMLLQFLYYQEYIIVINNLL